MTEAIYGAGFNSNGRFYAASSDLLGMTPSEFRAGGRGNPSSASRSANARSAAILVAATEKGVCAIELGDDPDALVREPQDRFPQAQLVGGDAAFEQLVAKVVGFVEAPGRASTCRSTCAAPRFSSGSGNALPRHPGGRDRELREIARRIGAPKAVRAVAQACASNGDRGRDTLPPRRAHGRRRSPAIAGASPRKRALLAREQAA